MRLTRIHIPEPLSPGSEIALPEQAGRHLVRVLRLAVGARFVAFDGNGGEFAAEIATAGKQVRARILRHEAVERESPLDITLLQGIARGERMDLIVQKASELGVARIVPVIAERSVVKVEARQRERKCAHWQSIVISACEQCGRNRVPTVAGPQSLSDAMKTLPVDSTRCLLAADGRESLAGVATRGMGTPVVLLIGPEGGLTDDERKYAGANGFVACGLGPRIMRTETAGIAALAALQAIAGDFANV
jgi:16S rRNA (uracil1498-N3)-methyltransferase